MRISHVLIIAALLASPVSAGAAPVNGRIKVSVQQDGQWRELGNPGFHRHLDLRTVEVDAPDEVRVRLAHTGGTNTHLDAVTLDGEAPLSVSLPGAARKLSARDYDVIDITGRSVELTFPAGGALAITARAEPRELGKTPFHFPTQNLYRQVTRDSAFYTYRLGSRPGDLTVDGDLEGEQLGAPFFSVFCDTGSGHPSGHTHGWVRDDGERLYVAMDFLPDNTMDGDKDYARLYVDTPAGVKTFQVSVPDQRWGKPGFGYTGRAAYEHKVYEMSVPLAALGVDRPAPGTVLRLAFGAYGTAMPPDKGVPDLPPPDQSKPDLPLPDQAAPDTTTPDMSTPDQSAPDRAVSVDKAAAKVDSVVQPPATGGDDGCDCSTHRGAGSSAAALSLLLALGLLLRRRNL